VGTARGRLRLALIVSSLHAPSAGRIVPRPSILAARGHRRVTRTQRPVHLVALSSLHDLSSTTLHRRTETTMPHLIHAARRSDPEFEWDDFATGDFESGEDPDA